MEQKKKHVELDASAFEGDQHAEMEKLYETTVRNFVRGAIVPGRVLEVRNNEVIVDIGYKSEGAIAADEFGDISKIKPGDEIDVLLEGIEDDDGLVILSRKKAEQKLMWEHMLATYSEGSAVEGTIRSRVKGGLVVDIGGVDAFLPGSQIDMAPVHDMDGYIGQKCEFKVLKINQDRRNIVVSRRELIEERMATRKKDLLSSITVGQARKGIIKNITDFGVFVDLNGMDGLLHVTDMSWGRLNHPSEMVSVGQEIEVIVLDVDLAKERVSLGLKQKTADPWEDIEKKYPAGSRLRGRVVNLAPYGAFVELEQGVEGLVHVSEMSWTRRVARASDVVSAGDVVDVVVLNVNKAEKRIALGMRQTTENPWDTIIDRYPVGSRVSGCVCNFTSYGAFVELEEGIDGMIHVSDMSWTRKVNHPSEVLKKGDIVETVVLEIDSENRRISLGLKQSHEDPWAIIASRYKVGQLVKGKVTKLAPFGAFVEIEEGIDGLVHVSQISDERVENVRDVLKPGQEVEARVLRIDPVERRIGLSIKAAKLPEEEFLKQKDEMVAALRPGEHMVDLAGAFDAAFGVGGSESAGEEWQPGSSTEKPSDKAENDGERNG